MIETIALYGALTGITLLNVGVYLKVGGHSVKIDSMGKKVTKLNGNLEDIKNVIIKLPCTDYNGQFHIKEEKNNEVKTCHLLKQ